MMGLPRSIFFKHALEYVEAGTSLITEGHRRFSLYEREFSAGGAWAGSDGLEIAEIWLLHRYQRLGDYGVSYQPQTTL